MAPPSPGALLGDDWLVFGNVYDSGGSYLYGYGPFPAPNDGAAFCAIATGEGGPAQGDQQLSVYSDYNNPDHGVGHLIETNVFQEQTIEAADAGKTVVFTFDAKFGNLEGASEAEAFIKTLDPGAGYATTNHVTVDMTTAAVHLGHLLDPARHRCRPGGSDPPVRVHHAGVQLRGIGRLLRQRELRRAPSFGQPEQIEQLHHRPTRS